MGRRRFPYLHGFGSNSRSTKGVHLRDRLAAEGVELELLDVNVPSFERQTYSAILEFLGQIDAQTPSGTTLCLCGSSMGGYLAARWAELHPDRVAGLFLLCPGFDLASRWPLLLGADAFERWKAEGTTEVEDGEGQQRSLHWEFVLDSRRHPAFPEVPCPTRIVHGKADDIVPIEFSRRYAEGRPHVELVELDDDHRLMGSLDRLGDELRDFIEGSIRGRGD